ncbi:hypothetical protein [Streptomyces sp. NPDC046978]|uniref:hypothetical protein n=1 Tax=Streptomyces sp. NPDC046978 TaxID=3154704 RepID=UPI0033EDA0B3
MYSPQAPDLHEALQRTHSDGASHVILDGKLFAGDRLGEQSTSVKGHPIDAWYSGKGPSTASTTPSVRWRSNRSAVIATAAACAIGQKPLVATCGSQAHGPWLELTVPL